MARKKSAVKLRKTDVNKALDQLRKYDRNIESGKESRYKPFAEAGDEIKKFLNKDGSVSKTKTRTKKAKQELQNAVNKVLKLGPTIKERERNRFNYYAAGAASQMKQKVAVFKGNETKARQAAEIFAHRTWDVLKKRLNSDIIITLSDSGFESSQIWDVLDYIVDELDKDVPDNKKRFKSEDDISVFVDHMANLHTLYPEMDEAEAVQIAAYMTDYRFNDYENIVEGEEWKS